MPPRQDGALTAVWGRLVLPQPARTPTPDLPVHPPSARGTQGLRQRQQDPTHPATGTWDWLWDTDPHFRRIWHVTTVIWGAALILDAAARVTIAYPLPLDVVPGLADSLCLVAFLALQVITNIYLARTGLWNTPRPTPQHDEHETPATPAHATSSPPV